MVKKLYLTAIFHCNLNYSSIATNQIKEVINTCYRPLLRIALDTGAKIGFEFSGHTLELINKTDKNFLLKLKKAWEEDKIEITGSGYIQSIFPLIPREVNQENLRQGTVAYERFLGKSPTTALVNEQTFSKGLIEVYNQHSTFNTLVLDWPNTRRNKNWTEETQYRSGQITDGHNKIGVLWSNSVAFQKFQKYVYGQINLDELEQFIVSHRDTKKERHLMFYCSDAEIFNYRPKNGGSHAGSIKQDEIKRIKEAIQYFQSDVKFQIIPPSEAIKKMSSRSVVEIGSAAEPIICKKQDKYNPTRWAVCGQNNAETNTNCHLTLKKILGAFRLGRFTMKKMATFWASDYRTFTEKHKLSEFKSDLEQFNREMSFVKRKKLEDSYEPGNIVIDRDNDTVETDYLKISFNKHKGGTIKSLTFKTGNFIPQIIELPQGYYDDISYGVDWFSGHALLFSERKKYSNLSCKSIKYIQSKKSGQDSFSICRVNIQTEICKGLTLKKVYIIHASEPRVDIHLEFNFKNRMKLDSFRPLILTFNPEAFDEESLYYETHNGGGLEHYDIDRSFDHSSPVDIHISAKTCLGATTGELIIGDSKNAIILKTDKSSFYSVPMLKYHKMKDSYFLRVFNTACETDETSNSEFHKTVTFNYSISAK